MSAGHVEASRVLLEHGAAPEARAALEQARHAGVPNPNPDPDPNPNWSRRANPNPTPNPTPTPNPNSNPNPKQARYAGVPEPRLHALAELLRAHRRAAPPPLLARASSSVSAVIN